MASTFGWLDGDETHRATMLELIRLFQDEGSIDELGIGSVRDTFSDSMFPATSVLHTRARYLLFIPWLLEDVTRHGWNVDKARKRLRDDEVRLIRSLIKRKENQGVIGSEAQDKLKSMPSAAYWAALRQMGICAWDTSLSGHLRQASLMGRNKVDRSDDDADESVGDNFGIHPSLPKPPGDLLTEATFELTLDEAGFLRDRLASTQRQSVYAWLARKGASTDAKYIWFHPQCDQFTEESREIIKQAKLFHHLIHGAAIRYNLQLARNLKSDKWIGEYESSLDDWESELADWRALDDWDPKAFWYTVRRLNPKVPVPTEVFVNSWIRVVCDEGPMSERAHLLLKNRETALKGGNRSRLVNAEALQRWSGRSGMNRLDYRWSVASRHLEDIYAAGGRSHA